MKQNTKDNVTIATGCLALVPFILSGLASVALPILLCVGAWLAIDKWLL